MFVCNIIDKNDAEFDIKGENGIAEAAYGDDKNETVPDVIKLTVTVHTLAIIAILGEVVMRYCYIRYRYHGISVTADYRRTFLDIAPP